MVIERTMKSRVLIVDSDVESLNYIESMLEPLFEVIALEYAEQAVDVVKNEQIKLVISAQNFSSI